MDSNLKTAVNEQKLISLCLFAYVMLTRIPNDRFNEYSMFNDTFAFVRSARD